MLALLQADYGNVGGTLPSGWTLINEHLEGRDLSLHAYYKIAAATEPPTYTWNVVNAGLHPLAGGTICFQRVEQARPRICKLQSERRIRIKSIANEGAKRGNAVCGFTMRSPADIRLLQEDPRRNYHRMMSHAYHLSQLQSRSYRFTITTIDPISKREKIISMQFSSSSGQFIVALIYGPTYRNGTEDYSPKA